MVDDTGNRACCFMMVIKGEPRFLIRVHNCSSDDWQGPLITATDGLIVVIILVMVTGATVDGSQRWRRVGGY